MLKTLILGATSAFATIALAAQAAPFQAPGNGPDAPAAEAAASAAQGVARFRVGRIEIIALSDGTLPLDVHPLLKGASARDIDALLSRNFEPSPVETSINAFLVEIGSRLILVDAGAGDLFGAVGGKLPLSLAAAGYRPEDVTDILVTHIHTDHSGGLTRRGKIAFPNARVHAGADDEAFFLDDLGAKAMGGQGTGGRHKAEPRHVEEARRTVEPYRRAGRLATFRGPTQLFPGVTALPAPGHTPGHAIYRLESEGESIEFWGDLVHVGAVQLPRPDITITFDVDQPSARAQRLSQFQAAARDGKLIAAAHLNFPGIGRLRAAETGYAWVPAPHRFRD